MSAWPMTLPGVDRIQHAIRRIVWRAMPTIPGMQASPVTIAEIVTDALRELDWMQADYAERRAEHVRVLAEVQRLEQLLATAVADLEHAVGRRRGRAHAPPRYASMTFGSRCTSAGEPEAIGLP